jgi:hypothetical protein
VVGPTIENEVDAVRVGQDLAKFKDNPLTVACGPTAEENIWLVGPQFH